MATHEYVRATKLKNKTIHTGYLCPAAEAHAPLDRQMGVGLGVLLQTAPNKNKMRPEYSGASLAPQGDQPDAHKRMLVRAHLTTKKMIY